MTLAEREKRDILEAVIASQGNLEEAAVALGVSQRTIYRRLRAWGLPTPFGGKLDHVLWRDHQRRVREYERALGELR